jgi:putative heme-binding domain-containing protein
VRSQTEFGNEERRNEDKGDTNSKARLTMRNARIMWLALVAAVSFWSLATAAGSGVEPWADQRLTVTTGLELWLDASRLPAARQAAKLAALPNGGAVEAWWDGSGNQRQVRQSVRTAQPRLVQVGDDWLVRFDGQDDYLRRTGLNLELGSGTLFVVAAAHTNPGDYRAFLAANGAGQRDYESGFTVDMDIAPSAQFEQLNVEGRGFGGAQNLLPTIAPFGTVHVIEVALDPSEKKVRLVLDGKRAGDRAFAPGRLRLDEITVGARYYTNGPGAQQVRGFLQGDISEVLLYNRVLSKDETQSVRRYLDGKYAHLKQSLPATLKLQAPGGQPLVRVVNPPPVQCLVPGFEVRQLPVDLTNINDVKYRPDGKLYALAYDGNVYLLSDTDGDGLEDKVELFWESKGRLRGPIGMALTPPGYPHGTGVFVPSHGKLSLIVDTDGDGKADKEIVVADGWKELPLVVDALGVAVGKDGSVYFGLGTADFFNPYQVDAQGKSHFDLKSERGTIQKVSPDFSRRETVCTGIRFSVALAFNKLGDLFATDQEGATWLANGNPFDELLHIQPGRHYGFPPRHPRHLPNVIDEPSVFNYGPQHQSSCGLNFNEPVNAGPTFGPRDWAGDALVTGESRGKLYRTKLVKTAAGYVAQNRLFARLNMLTIDACVSPQGDLVVTTHSGPPDWGTGPSGKGKLYKIRYTGHDEPQPVATWSSAQQEVRVAFDRPLETGHLQHLAREAKISFGKYVQAGDRFEAMRPPYAVVHMQLGAPRFDLPVYSAQVTNDRRTLILTTAPQRAAVPYAVMLPGLGRPAVDAPAKGTLPQHPQIDLDFSLNGLRTTWQPKGSESAWSGWLPHLDLEAARAFTVGSADHEALWKQLHGPGTLTLQTRLDLTDMLRPAVQAGARIDYEWPQEQVTVEVTASAPFSLRAPRTIVAQSSNGGRFAARFTVQPKPREPVPLELALESSAGTPTLTIAYHTAEDARPRALEVNRFLLPWAELGESEAATVVRRDFPELLGGSWARGRKVFFGEPAGCSKCHTVQGLGGVIGPDLSNLVHRDYASVVRDITEPSFAINPDYITYVVALKDGRLLTGAVRTQGEQLLIGDEKGQVTTIERSAVEQLTPAPKSVMPEGLPKTLGPEAMKDLLTFLLTEGARMPQDAKETPPPGRTRAEVQAALAGAPQPPLKTRPLKIVLVAGPKDHGPGEHDYPAWQRSWKELLAVAEQTSVTTAWEWPKPEQLAAADVLVFFQHGSWTTQRAKEIDAYRARGGGLVYLHWAVDGGAEAPGFAQRIGLAAPDGKIRFRHGPLDLEFTGSPHPIARNFSKVHLHDESYWRLIGARDRLHLLATSVEDGEAQPQLWTVESGTGRVFVSIPGHYSWTFDDPLFRILLLRGIAWTAHEPVDRFNNLVFLGARTAD